MNQWKLAGVVFNGGTEQVKALVGKRVRTNSNLLSARIYDPINNQQRTTDMSKGSVGFVANPLGADLLLAFPLQGGAAAGSLDALVRNGSFRVIVVNTPTFRTRFDVEVA